MGVPAFCCPWFGLPPPSGFWFQARGAIGVDDQTATRDGGGRSSGGGSGGSGGSGSLVSFQLLGAPYRPSRVSDPNRFVGFYVQTGFTDKSVVMETFGTILDFDPHLPYAFSREK